MAEWERLARENAGHALTLDQTLTHAHLALAFVEEGNRRWVEAERAFARAYRQSPNDAFLLNRYGRFMRNAGDYAEAVRLLRRVEELDPSAIGTQLGIAYRYARQFNEAAEALHA